MSSSTAAFNIIHTLDHVVLPHAREKLSRLFQGTSVARAGGAFGDTVNDTELRADRYLGEYLSNQLEQMPEIARISIEGFADLHTGRGTLWAAVDPLDGSLDYRDHGPVAGFPYSACVTILGKTKDATFDDVLGGVVTDLRNGDTWSAHRNIDGHFVSYVHDGRLSREPNPHLAETHSAHELDLGQMVVLGEFYYPENRERLVRAFAGKRGWLRNPGSAAYEMASVASGQAVAFICDRQKQHELGAGYALVKGAGGVAVDLDGQDLGPRPYDFQTQIPVVLAANPRIAHTLLMLLNKDRPTFLPHE